MKKSMPAISVLMPVYNGELYLREAMESILGQTFDDFEFIIIDDGSTDNTAKIIQQYNDNRVIFLKNDVNRGVTKTLNLGLEIAKGKFVARMDADDVALPERFERQLHYLNKYPEVGLLGSWVEWIDEQGNHLLVGTSPEEHNMILWRLFFNNSFVHSSVIFRSFLLAEAGKYLQDDLYAEDYGLWVRMSRIAKMANLPSILLKKRLHRGAVGSIFLTEQRQTRAKIMKRAISNISDMDIEINKMYYLMDVIDGAIITSAERLKSSVNLICNLFLKFISKRHLAANIYRQLKFDIIEKIYNIARIHLELFPLMSIYAIYRMFTLSPFFAALFIIKKTIK